MALLQDASTPSAIHGASGGTTAVTASFTPPAGSILVVTAGCNSQNSINTVNLAVTDNLGAHLTYNLVGTAGNTGSDGFVRVWWAAVATSAAMTVTVTMSGTQASNIYLFSRVSVITGANTTTGVGVSGSGRGLTGVVNSTYSATVGGSWGWLVFSDWSALTAAVPGTETIQDSYLVSGQISYTLIQQNNTASTTGSAVTMITTAPSSAAQISYIYFEILPALVAPSIGSVPSGTGMTAGSLSAPFLFFDTGDYSPGL